MMVAESIVELAPKRDKFESSKPNKRGNGGYHEEDEEGQSYEGNGSSSDSDDRKPRNRKWRPNSPKEKRGKLRCYFSKGPCMKRDCPKVSSVSAIKRNDEPEEAKPVEEKPSRVNSMVLIPKKRNGKEGLMFVDINITGQKRGALIDTGASDLFISEKAAGKLVQNMELEIGEWKGNEDFEVIQLDDYDFVLGLNFLDRIQVVLYPWADQIHIITDPLTRIVVPVRRDMKVGAKVLSSIQLVEDVSYGRNIDSIEWKDTKAPSEVLVAQEFDMKPADSTVESAPLGKVSYASGFKEKGAIQKQLGRVNAASKVHYEHFDSVLNSDLLAWQGRRGPFKVHEQGGEGTVGNKKPRCENQDDSRENKSKLRQVRAETSSNKMYQRVQRFKGKRDGSRGKGFEGRDNLTARQVRGKPRQREGSKVNQVSAIRKSQRGRCENGWGRMPRAIVQSP
ncbi:hypothetical protein Gotur_007158 [Gossypium turneri]